MKPEPLPRAAEVVRVVGDRYPLRRLLGKGGMGEVWLSFHPRLNVPVAVKILSRKIAERSPSFVQRLIQEGRLAVQLNHPGIVRVYDADNDATCHYIVMEYVDGCNAAELAKRRGGSLPAAEAVDLMIRMAEALREAARLNIIHRDLKPEKILIPADGGAKLADLGIAKQLGAASGNETGSGMTVGTPGYMSPEQAMNSDSIDFRSDIYSLGATFYRLVTGALPFNASLPLNVMMKHALEPLPHPRTRKPELPDNVCAVICKMMEKRPENRYASYDDLLEDLNKIKYKNASVRDLHASAVIDSLVIPKPRTGFGKAPAVASGTGSRSLWRPLAWVAVVVAAVALGLAGSGLITKYCSGPALQPVRTHDRKPPVPAPLPDQWQLVLYNAAGTLTASRNGVEIIRIGPQSAMISPVFKTVPGDCITLKAESPGTYIRAALLSADRTYCLQPRTQDLKIVTDVRATLTGDSLAGIMNTAAVRPNPDVAARSAWNAVVRDLPLYGTDYVSAGDQKNFTLAFAVATTSMAPLAEPEVPGGPVPPSGTGQWQGRFLLSNHEGKATLLVNGNARAEAGADIAVWSPDLTLKAGDIVAIRTDAANTYVRAGFLSNDGRTAIPLTAADLRDVTGYKLRALTPGKLAAAKKTAVPVHSLNLNLPGDDVKRWENTNHGDVPRGSEFVTAEYPGVFQLAVRVTDVLARPHRPRPLETNPEKAKTVRCTFRDAAEAAALWEWKSFGGPGIVTMTAEGAKGAKHDTTLESRFKVEGDFVIRLDADFGTATYTNTGGVSVTACGESIGFAGDWGGFMGWGGFAGKIEVRRIGDELQLWRDNRVLVIPIKAENRTRPAPVQFYWRSRDCCIREILVTAESVDMSPPVPGKVPAVTAATPCAEATDIISAVAARFPEALKDAPALRLIGVHDAAALRHHGTIGAAPGSYAAKVVTLGGGMIDMFGPYEELGPGRYIIVYRLQFLKGVTGVNACFLDVCSSACTVAERRPDGAQLPAGQWVCAPVNLDNKVKRSFEYRLWSHGHLLVADRVYVFAVDGTDRPVPPQPPVPPLPPKSSGQPVTVGIESDPSGAEVRLNAAIAGKTPAVLRSVPAGAQTLTLVLRGYEELTARFQVPDGVPDKPYVLKQKPGTLLVTSTPPGASVSLRGRVLGQTPLLLDDLKPGEYEFTVNLAGYEPQKVKGTVSLDRPAKITAELKDTRGSVEITTFPAGCLVCVDDAPVGKTEPAADPLADSKPVTVANLGEGEHSVKVKHPSGVTKSSKVQVQRAQVARVAVRLWVIDTRVVLKDGTKKLGQLLEHNATGDVVLKETPKKMERYVKPEIEQIIPMSVDEIRKIMLERGPVDPTDKDSRPSPGVRKGKDDAPPADKQREHEKDRSSPLGQEEPRPPDVSPVPSPSLPASLSALRAKLQEPDLKILAASPKNQIPVPSLDEAVALWRRQKYALAAARLDQFMKEKADDPRRAEAGRMYVCALGNSADDLVKTEQDLEAATALITMADFLRGGEIPVMARAIARNQLRQAYAHTQNRRYYGYAQELAQSYARMFPADPPLATEVQLAELKAREVAQVAADFDAKEDAYYRLVAASAPAALPAAACQAAQVDPLHIQSAYADLLLKRRWLTGAATVYDQLALRAPGSDQQAQYRDAALRACRQRYDLCSRAGHVGLMNEAVADFEKHAVTDKARAEIQTMKSWVSRQLKGALPQPRIMKFAADLTGEISWRDEGTGLQIEGTATLVKGAHLTVEPGAVITGGTIHADSGSVELKGTAEKPIILRRVTLLMHLNAPLRATYTIFEDCAFAKACCWFACYSSQWIFDKCFLYRSNFAGLTQVDYGIQLRDSYVIGCSMPPRDLNSGAQYADAWNDIARCVFIDCRVAPSFVWSTDNCTFSGCTVGEPSVFSWNERIRVRLSAFAEPHGFVWQLRTRSRAAGDGCVTFEPADAPGVYVPSARFDIAAWGLLAGKPGQVP